MPSPASPPPPGGKAPARLDDLGLADDLFDGDGKIDLVKLLGDTTKVNEVVQKILGHYKGDVEAIQKAMSTLVERHEQRREEEEADPEATLWKAMQDDQFFFGTGGAAGNPMAGRWQRFIKGNPEQKALYDATKGLKRKAEFRRDWCKQKYDEYIQERSFTTTVSEKSLSEGRYYTLQRMAVEEGGGEVGLRAA